MAKTVVALFDDFDNARSSVEALVDAGFDRDDISLVANDATGEYGRYMKDGTYDEDVTAGEGAGFGAVVGALVGLGVALIPGIGPVLVAGPLAAALFAGIGAASGAVTGGVVAGLVDFGVPEEHAERYAEGVRRGGTLVTVHVTQDEWAERAQSVLNRYTPVDMNERGTEWTNDNSSAAPLNDEQIQRDRGFNTAANSAATAPVTTAPPLTTVQLYLYYEPRFRTDYDKNYVDSGNNYTMYDPAYRYGYTLAVDLRYRDASWAQIEPEAHRYWDENYPGTWDRVKESVRDAWEQVTGR